MLRRGPARRRRRDCWRRTCSPRSPKGDGTATIVRGRDDYLAGSPDLRAAGGSARLTQVVDVDADRTLAMVEIRAERGGRTLHNFAGFLVVVRDDLIAELWMVDAKPAESDAVLALSA